jgi:hypothetical protein
MHGIFLQMADMWADAAVAAFKDSRLKRATALRHLKTT